jgi:hypothetical protein
VCRRSSTSCATCRHYRRSVAAQLGYCGLDPRRQPLTGDEIRGCWEGWPVALLAPEDAHLTIAPARVPEDRRRPLEFVEVSGSAEDPDDAATGPDPAITPGRPPAPEPGWSLWGDLDR